MNIRNPAVAGVFYPEDPGALQSMVEDFLNNIPASNTVKPHRQPRALIAPHAGYIYSGQTAAYAYKLLGTFRDTIKRIILLGPNHRVFVKGIAAPSCHYFRTPLGEVSIDQPVIERLCKQHLLHINDTPHEQEHSLEVHLPFLQILLPPSFHLVPLLVGEASTDQVSAILDQFWENSENLIIVSTDLSHFHPYRQAQAIDWQTTALIEQFSPNVEGEQACGCNPLNGLLKLAHEKQAAIQTLDVRNSGDTAGDKQRVVGYGAFALY